MPDDAVPVPPDHAGRALADWVAALATAVTALPDDGALLVTAPGHAARPAVLRRPRLGGVVPGRYLRTAPWVRLERVEDHLRGRCVGGAEVSGTFPLSPEEDAALLGLGWHHPSVGDGEGYVHFWPDDVPSGPFLPVADARRAASMVAETFRLVLDPPRPGGAASPLPAVAPD